MSNLEENEPSFEEIQKKEKMNKIAKAIRGRIVKESDGNEWLTFTQAPRSTSSRGLFSSPTQEEIAKGLRASSSSWKEWQIRIASCHFSVKYGGSFTSIKKGDVFYVDQYGRVLIGWHGTYMPPCGMDGSPLVDTDRWPSAYG